MCKDRDVRCLMAVGSIALSNLLTVMFAELTQQSPRLKKARGLCLTAILATKVGQQSVSKGQVEWCQY